jgi:hypothetical protein
MHKAGMKAAAHHRETIRAPGHLLRIIPPGQPYDLMRV